jgi:hypothetical protein
LDESDPPPRAVTPAAGEVRFFQDVGAIRGETGAVRARANDPWRALEPEEEPVGAGVSIVAVLAAAVVNMVVAAVWYSPLLFGGTWMAAAGASEDALRRAAGRGYLAATLASALAAFTLASSAAAFEVTGLTGGMLLGMEYGVGLAAPYVLSIMMFEARPVRLVAIDVGFTVVGVTAMGAVVGVL